MFVAPSIPLAIGVPQLLAHTLQNPHLISAESTPFSGGKGW